MSHPGQVHQRTRLALLGAVCAVPLVWFVYGLQFPPLSGAGSPADALFNAALFITWSVLHSLLARNFAKRFLARMVGRARLRIFFMLAGALTLFLVLLFWRPLPEIVWQTRGAWYWVTTAIFLLALGLTGLPLMYLDLPRFVGLGDPAGARKSGPELVVRGPYAYCRHPIYTFFIIALWIGPVMTWGRAEMATLATLYMIVGAFLEEGNLREELGEPYDRYRRHVPMFIPRLTPWRPEGSRANRSDLSEKSE